MRRYDPKLKTIQEQKHDESITLLEKSRNVFLDDPPVFFTQSAGSARLPPCQA